MVIAPGAEKVGHAQILNTFSKPFELEGLFGSADAGAFGSGTRTESDGMGEDQVMVDDDGDRWWDAEDGMDDDKYASSFLYILLTF